MMMVSELCSVADMHYIEPGKARFYTLNTDFLGLEYEGVDKKRVQLHRTLPVHQPDAYICVLDMEAKEIGIILRLDLFSPEQAALIRQELAVRYYSITVLRILSAKEKMGYVYFDLLTPAGPRNIAVKDVSKAIRLLDDKRIVIVDVDGNRYTIEDYPSKDRRTLKYLMPYLF